MFPFLFFSSICLYFLAKYTYVFKSFIFNHGEIDEEKILKWIRVVNATVAITLNFIGKKSIIMQGPRNGFYLGEAPNDFI